MIDKCSSSDKRVLLIQQGRYYSMKKEIERKFLVIGEYKSKAFAQNRIKQGYICRSSGCIVRIRISNEKGYLTIKGASDASGMERYEWEKEIPLSEARELMELCEPGIIDKTRYLIQNGKHLFEVDEFHGENQGLVIAEIELESKNETFILPDFIGEEVTGDRCYYNSQLAKQPFTTW
ncbi:Inorganic triphosphatase [termite gut metagenome]|uniref:Inorganic triphosphatase n=1 Tax=termite gut metagenome TaxID=433724 RepID=A0A5J4RWJ2_9ZZZZ